MIFFIAAMNITHIELKEKLVKTDNLMVATKKELLAVIKVSYTENTFQNWRSSFYEAAKEYALLINKFAKLHRLQ